MKGIKQSPQFTNTQVPLGLFTHFIWPLPHYTQIDKIDLKSSVHETGECPRQTGSRLGYKKKPIRHSTPYVNHRIVFPVACHCYASIRWWYDSPSRSTGTRLWPHSVPLNCSGLNGLIDPATPFRHSVVERRIFGIYGNLSLPELGRLSNSY